MKLEIQSVSVKNFLSFGDRVQEIDFKTGVNMVLGKDLATGRSNGAGKSTFLETIPFALYGTTHKDIVKSQLINWKNRKGLEVVLKFRKGEIQYRVERSVKPDNFNIYENNNLIEKPPHIRDYQKILEDIIGLNFNTFSSLIHSNINSSNRILSMSKPNKRKFIEDVFGLHLYSFLTGKSTTKINEQDEKIRDIQRNIDHNESSVSEIKEQIEDVQIKIGRLGSSESELRDAKILLSETLEDHPEIDNEIQVLESEIEKEMIKESENLRGSTAIDVRISGENTLLRGLKVKYLKLADAEKYSRQLENFQLNRGKLEDILENIITTKTDIGQLQKDFDVKTDEFNKTSIKTAKVETQFDNLRLKVINLSEHKECPACGQTLKTGSKDIGKKFTDELAIIEIEKIAQKNLMSCINKVRKSIGDTLATRKHDLIEMEENRDQIYEIKDKIQVDYTRKELDFERDEIKVALVDLKADSTFYQETAIRISNKLNSNKEILQLFKSKRAVIESKKRKIEALEMQVQLEERSKHEFQSIVADHKIKIDDYELDNIQLKKKSATYNTIIDYLEVIKELCKDENIKQYAISSIMPYLNKQTNHYLSEVGYGFYCILDRWLDADIKGPGVTNGSYGSLSGGEARGIDLAIQFALLDIARIQAGIWPDILIMDEVLDSSVDNKGITKLMDIIKMKQSEEKNKIFLISHREEIGDSIDADQTYYVTKDHGFSSVTIK